MDGAHSRDGISPFLIRHLPHPRETVASGAVCTTKPKRSLHRCSPEPNHTGEQEKMRVYEWGELRCA